MLLIMTHRWTQDKIIEEFNRIHNFKYDYSKVCFKNVRTKICVICPEHGEFWITPGHHLCGVGCAKCKGVSRLDTREFIVRARAIHGDKYDYSKTKYINKCTKVTITCPIHGDFKQKAEDHYRGRGCWKCYFDRRTEAQTYTWEDFLLKARVKYGWKFGYDRDTWAGYTEPMRIVCPKHGEFWQTPDNHLGCTTGCAKCGREKANDSKSLSQEEFIERAKLVHPEYIYDKTVFRRTDERIIVKCPKHSYVEVSAGGLIYNGYGCPKCTLKSQGVLQLRLQKRFPNCFLLWEYSPEWLCGQRFDIADEKYKIAVEHDGRQHFEPIEYFGGEEKLLYTEKMDALKNQKCLQNNFHLFRVPYNYDEIFFEELCEKIQKIIDAKQIIEEVKDGKE